MTILACLEWFAGSHMVCVYGYHTALHRQSYADLQGFQILFMSSRTLVCYAPTATPWADESQEVVAWLGLARDPVSLYIMRRRRPRGLMSHRKIGKQENVILGFSGPRPG